MMTDRITAHHLKQAAIVYIRQSTPEQVRNHAESRPIQIGLRDKAVTFGWSDPVIILDDLGISAGGFAHRAGFQHMAAEVSLGRIGIILCFEASRLSRNSKDWAQSFELCGHLNTLVADLDQVYDLALPEDRLILGVKGSVSEYELSLFPGYGFKASLSGRACPPHSTVKPCSRHARTVDQYVPSTICRWVRGRTPVVLTPPYQTSSCYDRVASHKALDLNTSLACDGAVA